MARSKEPPDAEHSTELERLRAEIERLRREVERQRDMARRSGQAAREREETLREQLAGTRKSLVHARRRLDGQLERRSIRLANEATRVRHGIATRMRRAALVAAGAVRPASKQATAGPEEARAFAKQNIAASAGGLATGPLVSLIVEGDSEMLGRLVQRTAYRPLELVAVAAADSVRGLPEDVPLEWVVPGDAESRAGARNRAARIAKGEWLLFLDSRVEPVAPGWLGCLVETGQRPETGAVGGRLVHPLRPTNTTGTDTPQPLTLRHAGYEIAMLDGVPVPEPVASESDASSGLAVGIRRVVAHDDGCLLVRRPAFDMVGGFIGDEAAGPAGAAGLAGVELSLLLNLAGCAVVHDGRAALWDRRPADADPVARAAAARDHLIGRWAPRLYRAVLRDLVAGGTTWRREPLRIALAGRIATADGVRARLQQRGWQIDHLAAGRATASPSDVLVTDDPELDLHAVSSAPVRVAVVDGPNAGGHDPWWFDADIVLARGEDVAATIEDAGAPRPAVIGADADVAAALGPALHRWLDGPRVGVHLEIPSWDLAEAWGDLHFARAVQGALARLAWPTRVHLRPARESKTVARDDVRLQILGRLPVPARPGQVNVLWQISHPDYVRREVYAREDLVFIASDQFAAHMASQVEIPVRPLHQATDPRRFAPSKEGKPHELLFVANSRNANRHILEDLLPTDHELAVYGRNWTPARLDPRYLVGEHIPNEELAAAYGAASIVLNDHWPDMEREGFLSNRLYDASAAGAFVISDEIDGIEEEFDGGIVTYRDRTHLRQLVERYLAQPDDRAERAARARAAVLERHTFDDRARVLVAAIEPLLRRPGGPLS